MSGRTIAGVVSPKFYEVAQQAVEHEGTSMSALVSSALSLYLGLSGSARRSSRYVLASGTPESRDGTRPGGWRSCARPSAPL